MDNEEIDPVERRRLAHRAACAAYRKRNPNKDREYAAANPEKTRAAKARYTAKNKEREAERLKRYPIENPEAFKKAQRKYYEKNKEELNAKSVAWQKANPEKTKKYQRNRDLKKLYGMSRLAFESMIEAQNNKCKICQVEFGLTKAIKPHVDHCHKSGKIRGLLCSNCNQGIGQLKDDPAILRNALRYLEES